MYKLITAVLMLLCAACHTIIAAPPDGLLPNGEFENGPEPSDLKGTVVTSHNAIPNWETSGYVEFIKSSHKQGDMMMVIPDGGNAIRLGNEASIKQKIKVTKGGFYAVTFSTARTCAQDEKLNLSVNPNAEKDDFGIFPTQTVYSSSGWDSYAWGFDADADEIELTIHNPGVEDDPACGPLIDSVALKILEIPKRTRANLLKNGNFEDGPYVIPNTTWGVLIPPHIEDDHSPLPGWIIESIKAVKYIDSDHFAVPQGRRAIELVAGKESALTQVVLTTPGRHYLLTFSVGDSNSGCEGALFVEAFAGKETVKVPYESKGKGGFKKARLLFTAVSQRTRVMFLSTMYTMTNDHSGSLCGPVIDDVKLLSIRGRRHG